MSSICCWWARACCCMWCCCNSLGEGRSMREMGILAAAHRLYFWKHGQVGDGHRFHTFHGCSNGSAWKLQPWYNDLPQKWHVWNLTNMYGQSFVNHSRMATFHVSYLCIYNIYIFTQVEVIHSIFTTKHYTFHQHPPVFQWFIPPFGNLHRYIQVTVVVPRATVEADVPWSSLTVPTRPRRVDGNWGGSGDPCPTCSFPITPPKPNMDPPKIEVWFRWFSFRIGWFLASSRSFSGMYMFFSH